jgi:uncharacterized protein RhaS with RHS repeats
MDMLMTELPDYRARYYDPNIGRFISEDPMGLGAGVNFYSYVHDNPVNLTDPLGLCDNDKNCIPRSSIPWYFRAQLALMSLASKKTGVSYFTGVQVSGTATGGGLMGVSAGGSLVLATDPQGNQALVLSTGAAATVGTPGIAGGIQIGAATYQNVSGFGGPSYGKEASGGVGLVVGGGYASNSSGVATYANISLAGGKNLDVNTNAVSNGNLVVLICPK